MNEGDDAHETSIRYETIHACGRLTRFHFADLCTRSKTIRSHYHQVTGMSAIEDLKRDEDVEIGSDRSFGIVFSVVFTIIGFWPLMFGRPLRWWSIGVAVGFLLIALVIPRMLAPLNRIWMKFGLLLAAIISPIFLALLFYLVFMPIGLVVRMFGKDPLKLKMDRGTRSYWVDREPPGPPPGSIGNQF